MVVYKGCIKNVLSRIYLEGVAYYGEPPQIYWDAKQALERLDNTCLTVNSNSDPNSPLGWRIKNYPILVVGKKNNKLKFSYTKKQLNNGDILIVVEEVADAYGNILTENKLKYLNNTMKTNKKVIRLTESDLHNIINEAVKEALNELDPRTYASAAEKAMIKSNGIGDKNYNRINKFRQAAIDAWNRDFGEEWDEDFPTQYGMGQDKGKIRLHYNSENGTYEPSQERTIWTPNANGEDDVISDITTPSRGRDVAHQMNFPSKAKYVKGKGW